MLILTLLACLLLAIGPIYAGIYSEFKSYSTDKKRLYHIFSFIPGAVILLLSTVLHLQKDKPPLVISHQCGVLKGYKIQQTRNNTYERISIQFDHAKYSRHFSFNEGLERKQPNSRVCVDFYDRAKNKSLDGSVILSWKDDI